MIGENYGIIHALKIDPNYFDDVVQGRKTFEIRKKCFRLFSCDCLIVCIYTNHNAVAKPRTCTVANSCRFFFV